MRCGGWHDCDSCLVRYAFRRGSGISAGRPEDDELADVHHVSQYAVERFTSNLDSDAYRGEALLPWGQRDIQLLLTIRLHGKCCGAGHRFGFLGRCCLDDEQAYAAFFGRDECKVRDRRKSVCRCIPVEYQYDGAFGSRLLAHEHDRGRRVGAEGAHVGRRRLGTPSDDEQIRDVRHVRENRYGRPSDRRTVDWQFRMRPTGNLNSRRRDVLRDAAPRIVGTHERRPVAIGAHEDAIGVHDVERVTGTSGLIGRPGEDRGVLIDRADADDNRSVHDCLLRR
jgi:hypothetical protein